MADSEDSGTTDSAETANAAALYERIRQDDALTQSLFRQALQDPKGTLARIVALGSDWNLPVSEHAIISHLASLEDDTKNWGVKARGAL
jgi:hypothetical protein